MSDHIGDVRQHIENHWKEMTFSELISMRHKLDDDGFLSLYARKIRNFHSQDKVKTRNELFIQMKKMKEHGDHFTLSEMKTRNPVLYDELVGQLLTEDEVLRLAQDQYNKYNTASEMLFGQIDNLTTSNLYYALLEKEGERNADQQDLDLNAESNSTSVQVNEGERELFKNEFISQMECQFLSGVDTPKLGDNDFDNLAVQDEEDDYFDSEDPAECVLEQGKKTDETEDDDFMTMDLSKF